MSVDGPVLLIGVGDLGARIGTCLVDAGRTVYGLRRSAADVPSEFKALGADITEPGSLQAVAGHLAGESLTVIFTVTAGERTEEAYRRVYVGGMEAVTEVLAPGRLVSVSSTAVYDVHDGSWVDEETPVDMAPDSSQASAIGGARAFSGVAMRDMEIIAAQRVEQATTVRLAGVYGPGRTRFIEQVRSGKAVFGPTPSYTNRIHVDDAARLVAAMAQHQSPPPAVVGVDNDPASRREVIEWMAGQLDVAVPDIDPNFSSNTNKRCRTVVTESLGFELTYPTFREGYAALL